MPGVQVDGNDVLAVIQVATEAVERARSGQGPTLIEALTYRLQAHSSSDDPSAYRDPDEPRVWERRDPLVRYRKFLERRDLWSEELERRTTDRYNDEISRVIAESDEIGLPSLETLFDDVYEDLSPGLGEQRDYLLSQPRVRAPHGG
jgi:TPP-dependent pyruvate/acetoin dehydrogenase alpha subunit